MCIHYLSLFLFFPLSGVRCCPQLFTASSDSLFHPTHIKILLCSYKNKNLEMNLFQIQGPRGNTLDYWNFVQSLRWLNPFIVPKLDEYSQTAPRGEEGATWLQSSLYDLNLSSQLRMLISRPSLTGQHYAGERPFCLLFCSVRICPLREPPFWLLCFRAA